MPQDTKPKLPPTPWGQLPPRMRVLFITGALRTGGWLADAFAADSASQVDVVEARGIAAGVTRLRDELFDAVLISHEGESLDALAVVDAVRAGTGEEQPILVIGAQCEQEMSALCFEAGADAYLGIQTTTTRALLWQVARARERHELIAENRRLQHAQRHRLQLEHDEAARLLQQQRALIVDLESIRRETGVDSETNLVAPASTWLAGEEVPQLPAALAGHYRELLRAYVIMGAGNLGEDIRRLAEQLSAARVTTQQVMQLHLHALEEAVEGLGSRSVRHVLNRADLLILEVMMNLAEGYRDRLCAQLHPLVQQRLPGFDAAPQRKAG